MPRSTEPTEHVAGSTTNPPPGIVTNEPDTSSQPLGATTTNQGIQCQYCPRNDFKSQRGLGVHVRSAHPDQWNEAICVEREELRMMARLEAEGTVANEHFINQYLLKEIPNRSLDAIKWARRKQTYKDSVIAAIAELNQQRNNVTVPSGHSNNSTELDRQRNNDHENTYSRPVNNTGSDQSNNNNQRIKERIRQFKNELEGFQEFKTAELVEIARQYLDDTDVSTACSEWLKVVFPPPPQIRNTATRTATRTSKNNVPRWRQRRKENAKMQTLIRKHMGAAAKLANDGPVIAQLPTTTALIDFWKPILEEPSTPVDNEESNSSSQDLMHTWKPEDLDEINSSNIDPTSAPGLDLISPRQWRAVPAKVRALFFNVVMAKVVLQLIWWQVEQYSYQRRLEQQNRAISGR